MGHKCKVLRPVHWSGGSGDDRSDNGTPHFAHVQTNRGEDLSQSNEGQSVTTVFPVRLPHGRHGADRMQALYMLCCGNWGRHTQMLTICSLILPNGAVTVSIGERGYTSDRIRIRLRSFIVFYLQVGSGFISVSRLYHSVF